jgi:hypothetical protein
MGGKTYNVLFICTGNSARSNPCRGPDVKEIGSR